MVNKYSESLYAQHSGTGSLSVRCFVKNVFAECALRKGCKSHVIVFIIDVSHCMPLGESPGEREKMMAVVYTNIIRWYLFDLVLARSNVFAFCGSGLLSDGQQLDHL